MKTKVCTRCKKEKPFSEFYKSKRNKTGVITECKMCKRIYTTRRWQDIKNNPVLYAKEKKRMRRSERGWSLRKDYGLTVADWNMLFDVQQGCCYICGKHQSILKSRLCVDHSHESGKVRSLLCCKCNMALGLVEESTDILQKRLSYVKNHKDI